MFLKTSLTPGAPRAQRGAALVIVLIFVVLFTGLVVAYLSQTITERQLSNSSFNETRADVLAHSAADLIIGDFKQEIVNGSAATTVGPASNPTTIYTPASPANMLPVRSGNPAGTSDAIPNLIRISSHSAAMPAPGVGSRASAVNSTTDASANGRSISLARWNKHYLIPRHQAAAAVDSTPISPVPAPYGPGDATGFTPPDWVFVTNANGPQILTAPDPTVNGRYAYAVYDEGGLLDLNAAGYPTSVPAPGPGPTPYPVYKPSLAFADLTVLPTSGGSPASNFPSEHVNDIVGWRNYASSQPDGDFTAFTFSRPSVTSFYKALAGSTTGFRTAATSVWNGRTDQMILDRQHLLALRSALVGGGGFSQDVLQYLGTFSRDLNQPSFFPDPTRPRIVAGDGGNDAYGTDFQSDDTLHINPPFLKMRVAKQFPRNDLTTAFPGEPLVKKRFALNRLAWLTYKGPSHDRNQNDVDIQALINAGIPRTFLQQGTGGPNPGPSGPSASSNIFDYFGLTWDDADTCWIYSRNPGKPIETLSQVATENREPNFIELLKATVNVGAIAKGASAHNAVKTPAMPATSSALLLTRAPVVLSWEDYQFKRDISTDYAIIQLAANIIDQFDTDGYPTRICIDNTGTGQVEFAGVENLPYFYRTRAGVIVAQQAIPPIQGPARDGNNPPPDPVLNAGSAQLTQTGVALTILEPEIWNPHDVNSSRGNPRPGMNGQKELQLTVDSGLPVGTLPSPTPTPNPVGEVSATLIPIDAPWPATGNKFLSSSGAATTKQGSPPFHNGYQPDKNTLRASNTALTFTDTAATLFREPTMLCQPGIPTGSSLTEDPQTNLFVQTFSQDTNLSSLLTTSPDGQTCVKAVNVDRNGKMAATSPYYFGIYLGVSPLRWVHMYYKNAKDTTGTAYVVSAHQADVPPSTSSGSYDNPVTYRMQYKDTGGTWRTYDQKVADIMAGGQRMSWSYGSQNPGAVEHGMIGSEDVASCIDPRTSRFGMGGGHDPNQSLPGGFIDGYSGFDPSQIDLANDVLGSDRIDVHAGGGINVVAPSSFNADAATAPVRGLPYAAGWYPTASNAAKSGPSWVVVNNPGNIFRFGLFSQNDLNGNNDGVVWDGAPSQANGPCNTPTAQYYTDPDGVARRAMGAYTTPAGQTASASTIVGLPTASAASGSQSQSRPIILNRPFRSVADLGYVFSGTPWKNLDFFTPESGYAALLDVFCTADSDDPDGLVAGKVNLNTRQVPVLQAILAGAYQDEENNTTAKPSWALPDLSALNAPDARPIAAALVDRTTNPTDDPKKGPRQRERTGRQMGKRDSGRRRRHRRRQVLSRLQRRPRQRAALQLAREQHRALPRGRRARVHQYGSDAGVEPIDRRGCPIRPLPSRRGGRELKTGFVVDGEQRYWVHVAIDRMTGQVLDKQVEVVKE